MKFMLLNRSNSNDGIIGCDNDGNNSTEWSNLDVLDLIPLKELQIWFSNEKPKLLQHKSFMILQF